MSITVCNPSFGCSKVYGHCFTMSLKRGWTERGSFKRLIIRLVSLFFIQATTALAETTALTDFRGLTVFSAIYVVYCIDSNQPDASPGLYTIQ